MIEHLITSTVLLAGILLIRMIFGNRMSQRLKYGLWLLAAIKLLIPLPMYETDISVMNVVQLMANQTGKEQTVTPVTKDVTAQGHNGKTISEGQHLELEKTEIQKLETSKSENSNTKDTKNVVKEQEKPASEESAYSVNTTHISKKGSGTPAINMKQVCIFIWLSGVILCGSIFLFSNIRFYSRLKKDRQRSTMYSCKLKLYETACVNSPCLYGTIKPAIYLPKGLLLEEEKVHYIMTHELTHYKHKDHIWSYIRCLCVVLYWYHPLVWMAAFLSIGDSELACDEGAVKCLGEKNRKAYGATLIEMVSCASSVSNHFVCSTGMIGGKKEMKKRIEMIVKKPKMLVSTFAVFLILVMGVTGCTFSKAKMETKTEANAQKMENIILAETDVAKTENKTLAEADAAKTENKTPAVQEDLKTKKTEETLQPTATVATLETNFENIPKGKYYLWFFPDELLFKKRLSGGIYYVPNEEMQKKIKELMDSPEEEKKITPQWIKEFGEHKEAGYYLNYKTDKEEFTRILVNLDDTLINGEKETYIINKKLCNLLAKLLKDEFQYEPLDVTDIKNIVSAKLDYRNRKNQKVYSQTIEDKEILDKFEDWFSHAEPFYGGSACPYEDALLTLTLKNGKVIKLSMASDGCEVFKVNGKPYDYTPKDKVEGFSGDTFFDCFDEIPNANKS